MTGMLSQSELESLVAAGDIDTVIVAFPDMQGRLIGKRVSARLFVDDVAAHGAECCNYLLAVDVDMNTVDGYAISSWETGYGDMVHDARLPTLRLLPVAAGHRAGDGRPVVDRRQAGHAGAAQHPARARSTGSPSSGLVPLRRHRARVHRVRRRLPARRGRRATGI